MDLSRNNIDEGFLEALLVVLKQKKIVRLSLNLQSNPLLTMNYVEKFAQALVNMYVELSIFYPGAGASKLDLIYTDPENDEWLEKQRILKTHLTYQKSCSNIAKEISRQSELGDWESQKLLSKMLLTGDFCQRDRKLAFYWFNRSCETSGWIQNFDDTLQDKLERMSIESDSDLDEELDEELGLIPLFSIK
jgi:hypothetical protein